jgi:hypothetical protein
VPDLPVARTPSWHEEQLAVNPACVKPVAGTQAVVAWQLLHSAVVWMCVGPLPVAVVPLWQFVHEPISCV